MQICLIHSTFDSIGAMIIAKWIDNRKTSEYAKEAFGMLDEMANRVRNIVQEEALGSSQRDPTWCIQILEGIKHVMYNEDKFSGNSQDYYNVNNSLITQVGWQIVLLKDPVGALYL